MEKKQSGTIRASGLKSEKYVLRAVCNEPGVCMGSRLLKTQPSTLHSGPIWGYSAHAESPKECSGSGNCGSQCVVSMVINKRT